MRWRVGAITASAVLAFFLVDSESWARASERAGRRDPRPSCIRCPRGTKPRRVGRRTVCLPAPRRTTRRRTRRPVRRKRSVARRGIRRPARRRGSVARRGRPGARRQARPSRARSARPTRRATSRRATAKRPRTRRRVRRAKRRPAGWQGRKRTRRQLRKVISKSKARGLTALLRKRPQKPLRRDPNLGKLVPIDAVLKKLEAQVKRGEVLPGDGWLTDYKRWQEEGSKGKPPGELTGSEKEKDSPRWLYQNRYVQVLIPDLEKYVPYIYRKVLAGEGRGLQEKTAVDLLYQYGCRRISRLMPGFAKIVKKRISPDIDTVGSWDDPIDAQALEKKPKTRGSEAGPPPYQPPKKPEIVEVCTVTHKQLEATLVKDLGLLVRAVKGRIGAERQRAGTELICPLSAKSCDKFRRTRSRARRTTARRKTAPRRTARARAPRRRTTRSRTRRAAKRRRTRRTAKRSRGGSTSPLAVAKKLLTAAVGMAQRGQPPGVMGLAAQAAAQAARARNRTLQSAAQALQKAAAQAMRFLRRPPVAIGIMGKAIAQARRALGLSSGKRRTTRRTTRRSGASRKVARRRRARPRAKPRRRLGPRGPSKVLFTELSKYRKDLTGETFYDIVKRLLTFYRKTGSARNFALGMKKTGQKIVGMAKDIPPKAQAEMKHQQNKKTVTTRNRRGLLRRQVDQWTYGYEYEQLRDFLKASKQTKGLVRDYGGAEAKELKSFWDDCLEIQTLCQNPRTPKERESCRTCAERMVKEHCIDGEKKGGGCSGAQRTVVAYLGLVGSQTLKKSKGKSKRQRKKTRKSGIAKKLKKFLKTYKYCITEMEPAYKKGRWPPRIGRGFPPPHAYPTLQRLANSGDYSKFQSQWKKWVMRDCFKCNCGRGAGCRNHRGGRKWHTKHAHCTIDCGGNNGFPAGLCYEGCKGGVDIGNFFDSAFKKLIGKDSQIARGPALDAKSLKAPPELHELRVGDMRELAVGKGKRKFIVPLPSQRKVTIGDGRNTFYNWLAMKVIREGTNARFHGGANVARSKRGYEASVIRNVVDGKFLPGESDPQKGIDHEGMRYLNSLPLTPWQRCYLWSPFGESFCDATDKNMKDFKGKKLSWQKARLFKMILEHPDVDFYLTGYHDYWKFECKAKQTAQEYFWFVPIPFTKQQKPVHDCKKMSAEKDKAASEHFKRGSGAERDENLEKSGDAIAQAVGPIVGKLLGMLLKAAGMYETMKTIAKAAGMTPEQSADCEDAEYRQTILKLPKKQDHKRGCLLKIFAKNFTTVLESIIIMLGNKLVDWGVDLLRTVLQPLKAAILAAVASVPFAGGVLATVFDIGWELLMNFGAKMLLKGFVVAQLPKWLKIRELATEAIEKVMEHPIVQVIAGIILQLLDAAMVHGEKSWMAVGADSVISAIQLVLQNPCGLGARKCNKKPEYFWIRALHYAKKEMRTSSSGPGDQDLEGQLLLVAKSMIGGFGAAVARNLNGQAKENFLTAVDEIKELLSKGGISSLLNQLKGDPVGFLTKFIAKKIGPVVLPVITSLVPMPAWAKNMLNNIATGLSQTLDDIEKGRLSAKNIVARIVNVFEPDGERCEARTICRLLKKLPISDPALQQMIIKGFTGLVSVLRNIDQIPAVLQKPWDIVKAVVDLTGDFLKAKVADLIQDPKLAPEKKLLTDAVAAILDVLGNKQLRERLFGSGTSGANPQAILAKVAELVGPYATTRLKALVAGSGLEGLVGRAAQALFGPQGPFARGAAFFQNLGQTLSTHGPSIAAEALGAVAGIVKKQADRLGAGPLGSLVQGVLGTLGKALKSPGGIAGLFRQGAASVLKLASDAFRPLLDALAPAGGKTGPVKTLLRSILGGVLDLLGKPGSLTQLAQRGVAALKGLAQKVAAGLRDAVKSLVGQVVPADLRTLATQAIDGFFGLLSNPERLTALKGPQILDLLKGVGQQLFAFVKGKVVAAVARLQLGPARAALQGVLAAILNEVEKIIGDPSRLRSLVEGNAQVLLGRVVGMLKKPALDLLGSLVPASVKAVVRQVADQVMGFLSNPTSLGQLGPMTPSSLLQKIAPVAKSLLEGVLKSVVPQNLWAQVQAAIGKVRAALANPAGLAQQAGEAARKAIDEVIAAALVRISDAGLRDLASNLIALVRDLVSSGGASLRGDIKAIFGRLVDAGARYLTGLLPAGPVRVIVTEAIDGLRGLLTNPAGLGRSLAQKAQALLPGLKRALLGLLQSAIQRAIPDGRIATLVSGLTGEIVGFVADPESWSKLQQQGVGFLLSRLIPVGRDFAFAMLGRLTGGAASALKGVVEGLLNAATRLLSNPASIASFAKNAVSALVSLGVNAVGPAVLGFVERATGNSAVTGFLRQAFDGLAGMLSDPGKLTRFLRLKASKAFGQLLGHAKSLVQGLLDGVIQDAGLKTLAKEGLGAVLDFVQKAAAGGGNLAAAAKAILAKLLPAVAKMAKGKLLELFPHHLGGLRDVLSGGLDRLVSFATDLVTKGKAAWDKLTSGGGKMFGSLVKAVLPLLKTPIVKAISYKPLRGLLTRLLDAVGNLLADPGALVRSFRSAQTAMKKLLPELEKVLGPFADEVLVKSLPRGIGRDIVSHVVKAGLGFLKDPDKLQAFIKQARDFKGLVKAVLMGLVKPLLKSVPSDALRGIFTAGLEVMVKNL